MFQFTLPCGERHCRDKSLSHACIVSIHAPVRGATSIVQIPAEHGERFNSRSRAGSDQDFSALAAWCFVSIHAPVRGATSSAMCGFPFS